MTSRFQFESAMNAYKANLQLSFHVAQSPIESSTKTLMKLLASMINGCSFCVDMHWKEARKADEKDERLYGLLSFRESKLYSAKEVAALEWSEALTLISTEKVNDELYAKVRQHYSDEEIAELSYVVVAINGWNRLCIAMNKEAASPLPNFKSYHEQSQFSYH